MKKIATLLLALSVALPTWAGLPAAPSPVNKTVIRIK